MFKLWSEIDKEAAEELKPDLGFRDWEALDSDEKYKIWKHLEARYFFTESNHKFFGEDDAEKEKKSTRIYRSVALLNNKYKANSFAENFLRDKDIESACEDFHRIFTSYSKHVVYEIISLYADSLLWERSREYMYDNYRREKETEEQLQERKLLWQWGKFDAFSKDLNDLFDAFGVDYLLTREGFVPRQSKEIIRDIYVPVLEALRNEELKPVNDMLKKAFVALRSDDYKDVVQESINTQHAYLQLKLHGNVSKKENLNSLIKQAVARKLIPNETVLPQLYSDIEGYLARVRKEKTNTHPSTNEPTKDEALFVLNLTMVILQSFLNYKRT